MAQKTTKTMQDLLDEMKMEIKVPEYGDVVEGTVVAVTKTGIWLDLGMYGTGVIMGPEVMLPHVKEDLKVGDKISASVVEQEFENGEILLSLGKATRERSWGRLEQLQESRETIMVKPLDANKGGLLIEVEGVKGFLPVSQLTAKNYPRVVDKDEILVKLNSLVGKPMEVGVLEANRKENKLILSEKIAKKEEIQGILKKFKVGDKAKCKVTGVVDFGIFVNVDDIEGLIHISEISWDKVADPKEYAKVGDVIDALIIGIEDDRLSLSIKRLTDDPWIKAIEGFKVGTKIKGKVTRLTPFGAFVAIKNDLEALVHISELSSEHIAKPEDVVEIGKEYEFTILSIDPSTHRLALTLKEKARAKKKEDKADKNVK
ncbi:MAG: S1 RNA-binding domain-containing protein [Patescibacteria group bacterium]|nr:S1 RNA-binding domain-containing protein [Patescibacteria group bacterium]MCL5093606.1 S1 RNA-binding domain-containing protein [Patescibacteria group bacterium]